MSQVAAIQSAQTVAALRAAVANETSLAVACEDRLAKFKRPKTIDFSPELPRDPSGKLYKRKLRDPYWEGIDRQI